MKIMVPVRRVPNPDVKVRLKKDGTGIETEGVNFLINSFDEYAIEEAVRLTEKDGGEVFLVSVGGPENEETLRAGLALGAARAYLVDRGEALESSAIAECWPGVYQAGEARPGDRRQAERGHRQQPGLADAGRAARPAPGVLRLQAEHRRRQGHGAAGDRRRAGDQGGGPARR